MIETRNDGGKEIVFASAAQLGRLFRSGELSPVELLSCLQARADSLEPVLHCFVTRTSDLARERARAAERVLMKGEAGSTMCGIPYGLKDVICTAGILTTGQSKTLQDHVPVEDAHVERLLAQTGGVLMGKLTTYEFAHGGPSWDLPWPPAMNPWKKGYLPGSTSSGAAAAVAAGVLPVAVGTDTGGSIRMPAAVCGIVGLKPTYGRVSRRGVLPNTYTFDTCGPMARTVEDVALALNAMAGFDDLDVGSVDAGVDDYAGALARGIEGLRIGWVKDWYDGDPACHPDIPAAMAQAMRVLEDAGAIIEEAVFSDLLTYQDCKTTISITEMFSAYEHDFRNRPQDFGLMFRNKVMSGGLIRAEDYVQALRQRLWLARELERGFRRFDILATAGWMTVAEPANPGKLDRFLRPPNITTPFNVGGQPAMSVPCGFSREGLPLSLQLAARHFEESVLLRAGHAYQQRTHWHMCHPTEGLIP